CAKYDSSYYWYFDVW
nr:immunoglobulin heavy chain junction region [Mus musculus]